MAEGNTEVKTDERKWWSKALLVGAVVGIAALPIGALGTKLGIWSFMGGFALLGVGVILATIVFFLGIIGAVYTNSKGLTSDRSACLTGVVISAVILVLMGNQFMTASSVPPIHNISTDTQDPPQFTTLVAVREADENVNPHEYDTEKLAQVQREAYPQIKPLVSSASKAEMFGKAVQALESLGMEVASQDPVAGVVEATDETFWFGFKDDVVVRVQSQGSGSVVDVRSVSRVGQSDLGKNAARIGEILALLQN